MKVEGTERAEGDLARFFGLYAENAALGSLVVFTPFVRPVQYPVYPDLDLEYICDSLTLTAKQHHRSHTPFADSEATFTKNTNAEDHVLSPYFRSSLMSPHAYMAREDSAAVLSPIDIIKSMLHSPSATLAREDSVIVVSPFATTKTRHQLYLMPALREDSGMDVSSPGTVKSKSPSSLLHAPREDSAISMSPTAAIGLKLGGLPQWSAIAPPRPTIEARLEALRLRQDGGLESRIPWMSPLGRLVLTEKDPNEVREGMAGEEVDD
jgi:hypothetical protein